MPLRRHFGVALFGVGFLGSVAALATTDLRGRAEVHRADSEIARVDEQLADVRASLAATRNSTDVVGSQVRATVTSEFQTQSTIGTTNTATASAEQGLFYDGYGITQLNECLTGVIQALDQVSVGQVRSGLASLDAVSGNCSFTRSTGG